MAIVKTIKNLLGTKIYPKTITKAVYSEDGKTRLDNLLKEMDERNGKIEQLENDTAEALSLAENALPLSGGKMSGVLQTRGGDVNTEQIALGNNTFIYSSTSNGAIILACNAKTDDGTSWYRVEAGTASITFVSNDGLTRTHKAESGEAGSAITWGDVEEHLTSKTGLPISGGTLLNSLEVFYNINPFFQIRTETQGMTKLWKACDETQNWGSYLADMSSYTDFTCLILRNESDKENRIAIQKSGDSTQWYRIYGEHNVTVSTSAPTSAIAEGCMHMTY